MTEEQVDAILREVFGYLIRKGIIAHSEFSKEIEPRIKAQAKRIAEMKP